MTKSINKTMNKEKVVLAYSGGLDTSFCIKYLSEEKGLEVHTVAVNTGGFDEDAERFLAQRANDLGAASHRVINALEDYYRDCIRYLIFGNVLKNNTYPLSVSSERFFQAMVIAEYANKIGAQYVAHGSTGAGNDQVRFDLAFQVLAPQVEIITPIRDLGLSRQQEVDYLKKHGVDLDWEKAQYSINKGIWGTSVGGKETLTSKEALPSEAYPSQPKKEKPKKVSIGFEQGEPVLLNGQRMDPIDLIQEMNTLAGEYAIGRDIHVGDTIIGIKGRVGFEAPGPLVIIDAHALLEKHTLSAQQLNLKSFLGNTYGNLLHEAMFFDPAMRDIEGFLSSSQRRVSGTVYLTFHPYRYTLDGIESKYDLMASKVGQYGETNEAWSSDDAKGFIKIYGMSQKIYYSIDDDHGQN